MRSHLHCRVENQWGSVTSLNTGPTMRQPLQCVTAHGDTFRREEWVCQSPLLGQCRNTSCRLGRVFYNEMKHKEIRFDSVNSAVSQLETMVGSCEHATNFGFHTRGGICSPVRLLMKLSWWGTILQRATLQFRVLHVA